MGLLFSSCAGVQWGANGEVSRLGVSRLFKQGPSEAVGIGGSPGRTELYHSVKSQQQASFQLQSSQIHTHTHTHMRQPLTGGEHDDDTSVSRGPQQPSLAAKGHTIPAFLVWGSVLKSRRNFFQGCSVLSKWRDTNTQLTGALTTESPRWVTHLNKYICIFSPRRNPIRFYTTQYQP